jgi:peroxiredoxin
LIVLGHRDCKTTRQTLPYVDRLHRRKGADATVLAVLQDDPDTASTLVREQGLELPVLLEADPYPLAAVLRLETVPTLFLVGRDGAIQKAVQGFNRAELEGLAARLGVAGPLFVPEDNAPAYTPG